MPSPLLIVFSPDDTIVAIATPPGRGGIGVVRISGPAAHPIALQVLGRTVPLQPRYATLARVHDVDEVIATYFLSPHSYTGQDVVEISAHGSPVVLQAIQDAALRAGARLASPGEFTLRAFLNGRIDLVQSEAVADLIDAATPLQARTAFDQLEGTLTRRIASIDASLFDLVARLEASLDFPEEGYHFVEPSGIGSALRRSIDEIEELLADARRGRTIREGAQVVICGRPNVGKSSVFNCLAGHDRAIVSGAPGTTRDLISETVDIEGLRVVLVDTAGVRESVDLVEREGVERARQAAGVASVLVMVFDQSEPLRQEDRNLLGDARTAERVLVRNKVDRPAAWQASALPAASIGTSATARSGFDELRRTIADRLAGRHEMRDSPAVSNARHIALLERAREHLVRAVGAGTTTGEEFLLTDLHDARVALEEITGKRTTDDMLRHIFERFCIGK